MPTDINPTLAPSGTRRVNYSHLGEGWMLTHSTLGIATVHELWVDEDGCTAIYVARPESGPADALRKWATLMHDRPSWDLPSTEAGDASYRVQMAAERWVAEQAHREVLAEMGYEL